MPANLTRPPDGAPIPDTTSVNEIRLGPKQWAVAIGLLAVIWVATPWIWDKVERFETGPDYRIPYSLSRDYWLYRRRMRRIKPPDQVLVLGDSVVWGEYVLPEGTWTHFLNESARGPRRFINGGVNGLFPLALDGLTKDFAGWPRETWLMVHCNVLWMSSPKADLQVEKEEKFNHSRLVPQFFTRIPCYKADAGERLGAVFERKSEFISWVNHLQCAYFGDKSIPAWTLQDDAKDPPSYPNALKNPLAEISLRVPTAPEEDPQRGPASARHRPWTGGGGGPVQFEWVELESSLQWAAFKRVLGRLRARGAYVLVVLGPFNEHLIAKESQPGYAKLRDGIVAWLGSQGIPHLVPAILPSDLYADASHPLTDGYRELARAVRADPKFRSWAKE